MFIIYKFGIVVLVGIVIIILFFVWLNTKNRFFKILLLSLVILGLFSFLGPAFSKAIFSKTKLSKDDYYGDYIIDRKYFPGKQADWQYNSYRFTITETDSMYFYITKEERIIKTYSGTISTVRPYSSDRLVIHFSEPRHHIIETNPTTFRQAWNFHLVFKSKYYYNLFFRKGEWEEIENE